MVVIKQRKAFASILQDFVVKRGNAEGLKLLADPCQLVKLSQLGILPDPLI